MVSVVSQSAADQFSLKATRVFDEVPIIDFSNPDLTNIVQACQEFGFFKLINHGIPISIVNNLERNALELFFNLTQAEKDRASSWGSYGSRNIGRNDDKGWVEYLLFFSSIIPKEATDIFDDDLGNYISEVKSVSCKVLELIDEGLKIKPKVLAKLVKDVPNDFAFRINHYPEQKSSGKNVVGFGEHTDPQIISVLRSNDECGLEIFIRNRGWVSVAPDPNALFISVGDCLEVLTNGKFKSVRHRVSASSSSPRLSMIYFAGPCLDQTIAPLEALVEHGEQNYKSFAWSEYKQSLGGSKLGDDRLGKFRLGKFKK